MEPTGRDCSPIEAEPALGIEEYKQPGIVLVVNPILSAEETTVLFQAAWGELAPDSPPATDRCLAHICAYHDGRLIGFVKLAWDGGIHAFILDTTVHPDDQRRGIGRQLVDCAVEIAGQSGIEWLHVDYEPAFEGFYARCGFRPTQAGLLHIKHSMAD